VAVTAHDFEAEGGKTQTGNVGIFQADIRLVDSIRIARNSVPQSLILIDGINSMDAYCSSVSPSSLTNISDLTEPSEAGRPRADGAGQVRRAELFQ
jgi:hypothetical protein